MRQAQRAAPREHLGTPPPTDTDKPHADEGDAKPAGERADDAECKPPACESAGPAQRKCRRRKPFVL